MGRDEARAAVDAQIRQWIDAGMQPQDVVPECDSWRLREVFTRWLLLHAIGFDDEVITIRPPRRDAAE